MAANVFADTTPSVVVRLQDGRAGTIRGGGDCDGGDFRFMQATAKTAMRRVLGIRGGQGETLVPLTAVAGGDEGFLFESEASNNNNSG